MKRAEIIEKIIDLLSYDEVKADLLNELDNWNGYLGDDKRYSMYDFDDLFYGKKPMEIAEMVSWGSDDEGSSYFRTDRDYFYFDGYGHIVSTDSEINVDDYDSGYIIDEVESIGYSSLYFRNDELESLFEELENLDEDEDEEIA